MSYTILYHPKVREEDIESLDKKKRKILAKAIEAYRKKGRNPFSLKDSGQAQDERAMGFITILGHRVVLHCGRKVIMDNLNL
jgi:hypothetical protein